MHLEASVKIEKPLSAVQFCHLRLPKMSQRFLRQIWAADPQTKDKNRSFGFSDRPAKMGQNRSLFI